jgi:CheY-like chemotaxis protein
MDILSIGEAKSMLRTWLIWSLIDSDVRPTFIDVKRLDILLVSDDRAACALFGTAVNETGNNICLQMVTDGEQAIEYLDGRGDYAGRFIHAVPDLVMLDLDTRLAGGLFFMGWLSSSASYCSLPVVILSTFAYKGALATVLAMGNNTLITTPLELEGWKAFVQQIRDLAMERREAIA